MAILREVYDRLSGAIKVILGSAVAVGLFDFLKGIAKEKGAQAGVDFIKTLATGKGLGDQAVYAYILGRCNLTLIERNLLIRAIEELRASSEKERQIADNFVILVALSDPDPKNGKRPGEKIIHGFIHRIDEYPTDAEKIQMIKDNVVHIGTDAETKKKVAIVQKWAIEAWKKLLPLLDSGVGKVGDGILFVTKKVDRQYEERLARSFERTRRRKANKLNWINPILWLESFIDLG